MSWWTILDGAGTVVAAGVESAAVPNPAAYGGASAVALPGPVDTAAKVWSGTAWQDDMSALRSRKKELVRARRDKAEWAGAASPSGPIDTDPDSQRKIGGAATLAVVGGASFSIQWRMKDNTIVTLNAAGMIALGAAVAGHVGACQTRKNVLDAAIAAATTAAELAVIDMETGWP